MSIFVNNYAQYYDLFYESKNYTQEAHFILTLAKKFDIAPDSLLDLGSGTGRHAIEWAKKGITVKGVERSPEMIKIAEQNLLKNTGCQDKVTFEQADMRCFDIEPAKYNVITSMFAVLGYITSLDDLVECFSRISQSLRKGGLFICDTWHGAAVLTEKPTDRIYQFDQPNGQIFRIVQSSLRPVEQVVTINYTIIHIGKSASVHKENHEMRFFFAEEMRLLGRLAGLELVYACPFLEEGKISTGNWNVNWVFKKF
ncbi:class I SAM-dependent methyltransferase [uncultured Candidatus Kuenenia sp.]|uniref:class I SAM-dependent DNA methyltransferase n=1 Tax=uncultured Candidatus Kuenenia sp. TaxID=1048336 RepID=UPI0003140578|nr:class I SAM-dependent methyltransferase [uncultured Candidatus Kuenenia sp.]